MNKKEVAAELNISTRLVERYAGEGRLGVVSYVKGRTGRVADFDADAVQSLKATLREPTTKIATNERHTGLVAPQDRERFLALVEALTSAGKAQTLTLETRLFLTLKEAAQVAGLPRAMIKRAIDAGKLKAVKTGSGWRVKSEDLSEYARGL
jgi:excisionase family DNA binding protein